MDRIGHGAVLKILSTSPRSVRRSLHHVRPDHACHEGADVQPPSTRVPKNNRQHERRSGSTVHRPIFPSLERITTIFIKRLDGALFFKTLYLIFEK